MKNVPVTLKVQYDRAGLAEFCANEVLAVIFKSSKINRETFFYYL